MKEIFKAVVFFAGIIGQVYLSQYTTTPRLICHIAAVAIAVIVAFLLGGVPDDMTKVFKKDGEMGTWVSLTWGVFFIMFIGLQIFTFIAYNGR